MLKIPVGLRHVFDVRAADENGRRADENVEAAKRADDGFDQFRMPRDRAQIGGQRQMRAALHLGDDRLHFLLREVDDRNPRAGRAKGQRNLAPDAARAAGDEDALAFEPRRQIPAHRRLAPSGGAAPAGSST